MASSTSKTALKVSETTRAPVLALTVVTGRLENVHTLVHRGTHVAGVVRGVDRREERDVDALTIISKAPLNSYAQTCQGGRS